MIVVVRFIRRVALVSLFFNEQVRSWLLSRSIRLSSVSFNSIHPTIVYHHDDGQDVSEDDRSTTSRRQSSIISDRWMLLPQTTLESRDEKKATRYYDEAYNHGQAAVFTKEVHEESSQLQTKNKDETNEKVSSSSTATTPISPAWYNMFNLLLTYKLREGHCHVPQFHKEGNSNKKLGAWLNMQRQYCKDGVLNNHKRQLLEDVGVVWNYTHYRWHLMYNLLEQYKDRVGHCNVPISHKEDATSSNNNNIHNNDPSNINSREKQHYNLGIWLRNQKQLLRKGKLDTYRQKKLENIGAVDIYSMTQKTKLNSWDNMFTLLKQYKDREGHCNVPFDYKIIMSATCTTCTTTVEGSFPNSSANASTTTTINLGVWVATQRQRKKKGTLPYEKQKLLEGIGIIWRIAKRRDWNDMFAILQQYKEREGHCNVPQKHKEQVEEAIIIINNNNMQVQSNDDNFYNLGIWLNNQRIAKKTGKLDFNKEKQLENLGVIWEQRRAINDET